MSTRVKQRAVTEFLTSEKVTLSGIHRRLKAVYGDEAVDRSTINGWAIKLRDCEPLKAIIVAENAEDIRSLPQTINIEKSKTPPMASLSR